jgi:peptidoglycan hydrolase-like protein with peptidoglycan-binding domain
MYAITKTVKKHRLTEVKQLQALLHLLGYTVSVDGMLGDKSKKAINQFQQKHNFAVGEIVRRDTWLFLYKTFNQFMRKLADDSIPLKTRGCQLFNTEQSPFITLDNETKNTVIVTWLQVLLYLLDNNTRITRIFDAITIEKIKDIQQKHRLPQEAKVNAATWKALFSEGTNTANIIANLFLTEAYIKHKAEQENIDIAIVKTVIKVESIGSGFSSSGQPKILFEGHQFWKQLDQQGGNPALLQDNNKDILYPKWASTFYTGRDQGEYDRLKRAKIINKEAALKATSWGMFHMMGFNAKACGFDDVKSFITSLSAGENHQLDAFFAFLHHEDLFQSLKNKDWATFANRYNGVQFRNNGYDQKLQVAFDITKPRTCSTRSEATDTLVINEYTRLLEEAFTEFNEHNERKVAYDF